MNYSIPESMKTARREYEQEDLHNILAGINKLYRQWLDGSIKTTLPISMHDGKKMGSFLLNCAEAARLALAWSREPASDRPHREITQERLELLLVIATDAVSTTRHLGSDKAESRLKDGNTSLPELLAWLSDSQMLIQRDERMRPAQCRLMYEEAANGRAKRDARFNLASYRRHVTNMLGCDIEKFVLGMIWIQCCAIDKRGPEIMYSRRLFKLQELFEQQEGLTIVAPIMARIIKRIEARPYELRAWMKKHSGLPANAPDELHYACAPNPLHRFPLILPFRDNDDCWIVPLPKLIYDWLYEQMAEYLCEADRNYTYVLASIFEEYVGLLLQNCSPDGIEWLYETSLVPSNNGQRPDYAREFAETVIMVDAKRAYVGVDTKYSGYDAAWDKTTTTWARAVEQMSSFWDAVTLGMVPPLASARDKKPVAIVATHFDHGIRPKLEMAEEIVTRKLGGKPHIPFIVLSADKLERLLSGWEASADVEWLPQRLAASSLHEVRKLIQDMEPNASGYLSSETDRIINLLRDARPFVARSS
jgi:hypothetical protein